MPSSNPYMAGVSWKNKCRAVALQTAPPFVTKSNPTGTDCRAIDLGLEKSWVPRTWRVGVWFTWMQKTLYHMTIVNLLMPGPNTLNHTTHIHVSIPAFKMHLSGSSSDAHSPPSSMSKQMKVENTLGCVTVLPSTSTRGGRTGYSLASSNDEGIEQAAWSSPLRVLVQSELRMNTNPRTTPKIRVGG